jgi:4-alpha-glucanotransferase
VVVRAGDEHVGEPGELPADALDRLAEQADLEPGAPAHEAVQAAHGLLARFPGLLLSATLDDAVAEPARPNVPGADRPENWCLALPEPLEDLEAGLLARRIAHLLADATGRPTP